MPSCCNETIQNGKYEKQKKSDFSGFFVFEKVGTILALYINDSKKFFPREESL